MAKEITLPKLSEDADEGSVAEVMIAEGDTIEEDDTIIAVESDKATVEVPSPEAGTVKEVKVSEGNTIKTGDVIALLEDEDEDESEDQVGEEEATEQEQEEKKDEEEQETEKEETEEQEAEAESTPATEASETKKEKEQEENEEEPGEGEEAEEQADKEGPESEEIPVAPGAKRLARKHDVDLVEVEGSGPDDLITANDVKKAAGISREKEAGEKAPGLPDFSQWGPVEREPLSDIRKATARQTQSSWKSVPHVTQFDEADATHIQRYIEEHRAKAEEQGTKITLTAVLTKMVANALHQFPKFNASIDMEAGEVILKKYVHIGVAVDTDKGLLVPVIRNVNKKNIIELADEIMELAEKARAQELSKEDMEGGNFVISNLGGIGGTQFTPVIYHPQVAILGISEMKAKPVYEDQSFQPVLTLPLSLSYDHRLIDGAEGARFMRFICNELEDPYKALLGK